LSLFARLYDPPRGSIFLDGTDVLDWDLVSLRSSFSFVPQATFLFSDTIRRNIEFGAAGPVTDQDVARLTALTTLDRDLGLLPSGYATEIGERGVTLSGGQRQRVALARALASDAPILVLDDSLSAVYAGTEHAIIAALAGLRRGRTVMLISHRINVLSGCDSLLVFDGGRLVQQGAHAELMRVEGFYREIAELQAFAGAGS
jgi:ATP-binding cassette subfamily B multidrug efflux pump